MDILCPYCGMDAYAEDVGDHPWFLDGYCDECESSFAWDDYRGEYYNEKGDVIKRVQLGDK